MDSNGGGWISEKTTRSWSGCVDRMIPHYYHIHETSSGVGKEGSGVEIATFEPRYRVPAHRDHVDHIPGYKAGSLALLLNGAGGGGAHIFSTLGVKRPGVGFIMSRTWD